MPISSGTPSRCTKSRQPTSLLCALPFSPLLFPCLLSLTRQFASSLPGVGALLVVTDSPQRRPNVCCPAHHLTYSSATIHTVALTGTAAYSRHHASFVLFTKTPTPLPPTDRTEHSADDIFTPPTPGPPRRTQRYSTAPFPSSPPLPCPVLDATHKPRPTIRVIKYVATATKHPTSVQLPCEVSCY